MTKNQMQRFFSLILTSGPKYLRCYDSKDSLDCMTFVFSGVRSKGLYISSSILGDAIYLHNYTNDQKAIDRDFNRWPPAMGKKCFLGVRIPFKSVAFSLARKVLYEYCELWNLPFEEARDYITGTSKNEIIERLKKIRGK